MLTLFQIVSDVFLVEITNGMCRMWRMRFAWTALSWNHDWILILQRHLWFWHSSSFRSNNQADSFHPEPQSQRWNAPFDLFPTTRGIKVIWISPLVLGKTCGTKDSTKNSKGAAPLGCRSWGPHDIKNDFAIQIIQLQIYFGQHTVDGQNPAPVGR